MRTLPYERRLAASEQIVGAYVRQGVYVPLPQADGEGGVFSRVNIEDAPDDVCPAALDADGRAAVQQALDEAWTLVFDGPDPRPRCRVSVPVLDALAPHTQIEGPSLHLAVVVAAVAYFSREPPRRHVLATGSPEHPLGDAEAKVELARDCAEAFRGAMLLGLDARFLGDRAVAPEGLKPVGSVRQALDSVLGFVPWHPRAASVRRVHAWCGERADPPARWASLEVTSVELPADLSSDKVERAIADITRALAGAERIELSLAAPNTFAPCLGRHLGRRTPIRLVHFEEIWWSSVPHATLGAAIPGEVRVGLTRGERELPEGWSPIRGPGWLTPSDVPRYLEQLATASEGGTTVHLGIDVPWCIGFAAGALLANQRAVVVHAWDKHKNVYAPWFNLS